MLYHDIPKVVVREFPINERENAEKTYQYLQSCGILSAKIKEVELANTTLVLYVFSERQEFISNLESNLSGVTISDLQTAVVLNVKWRYQMDKLAYVLYVIGIGIVIKGLTKADSESTIGVLLVGAFFIGGAFALQQFLKK